MPIFTTLRMRLPVWPVKAPLRTRVGEIRHRVEHLVDVRHHVGAVDLDAGAARRAQRDVQHGAAFRGVDLLAGEHRIAPLRHAALFGQLQQQPQRLVGDAVLRVVEEQARAFGREALRPAGIVGEQLAQMHVLDLRMMRRKRLPGRRARSERSSAFSRVQARTLLLASIAPSSSCQDFDEALGAVGLQLRRQRRQVDARLGVRREHRCRVTAVARQRRCRRAVIGEGQQRFLRHRVHRVRRREAGDVQRVRRALVLGAGAGEQQPLRAARRHSPGAGNGRSPACRDRPCRPAC